MNFLALVNRARRECGISSSALPTLASGLTVEDTRIKTWVNEAWREVQLHKPDWEWMRKTVMFNTVASQVGYTPTQAGAEDMADWKRDSFRAYLASTGVADEQILPFMDYGTFRNVYGFGTMRTTVGRPVVFTITPSKTLSIGPVPDTVYTVEGEYYRKATDLEADADSPSDAGNDLDERWHMLIVWRAALSYAAYEGAAEVWSRADRESARIMNRLEFDQLPMLTSGPPLA